jgi:hypothetical protein
MLILIFRRTCWPPRHIFTACSYLEWTGQKVRQVPNAFSRRTTFGLGATLALCIARFRLYQQALDLGSVRMLLDGDPVQLAKNFLRLTRTYPVLFLTFCHGHSFI